MKVAEAMPRVSVVITTYNYAAFIREALDSVLMQSQPPDELVVIDDGSTDNTATIVAAYADQGVHYIYQPNQGAGAARNRGIAETTGELIAFLDADDIWLPDKLAQQVDYLQAHPEIVLVSGQKEWWVVNSGKRWIERYNDHGRRRFARDILIHNLVGNPSMVLLRRHVLVATGTFDQSLRWGQDWELWIRIAAYGPIAFLPDPVIIYRWHDTSLTHLNKWTRLFAIHAISRSAIKRFAPRHWQPLLLARARSASEYDRARIALSFGWPRRRLIWHAGYALLAYPFESTLPKVQLAARVLMGERVYQRLRQLRHAAPARA